MNYKFTLCALLAGVLTLGACSNGGNQNDNQNANNAAQNANVNPQKQEKIEVKDVEGRKNFSGDKSVITPLPAIMIATYDADGTPDVMMAAWGGQCGPHHVCFNLSPHKTTENIKLKQAFTVSFASKSNVVESDYFGIVSGNDIKDKVAKAGFTVTKSPNVDAPIINEYPLTLECRAIEISQSVLGETYVIGEVVNMSADESILNADGNIDLGKLLPVIYDSSNHTYRVVGEEVGTAWGSGKAIQDKQ